MTQRCAAVCRHSTRFDTCYCLRVSEPERLAHRPLTLPGDRLRCAPYRPDAPVAVRAACGQLAQLVMLGRPGRSHRAHKPRPATIDWDAANPSTAVATGTTLVE